MNKYLATCDILKEEITNYQQEAVGTMHEVNRQTISMSAMIKCVNLNRCHFQSSSRQIKQNWFWKKSKREQVNMKDAGRVSSSSFIEMLSQPSREKEISIG